MRESLHEDPAILEMAERLQTRPEHVVGYCHKFWSWVSRNCNDGIVTGVTLTSLGSVLGMPNFPEMLCEVGWLQYTEKEGLKRIVIPKFDRHLSQGAKTRGLAAERVRNARVAKTLRSDANKNVTREEKIREEYVSVASATDGTFKRPTLAEVEAYCQERGKGVSAQSWFDHYQSNGWKVGKNAMKDWKAAVRKWENSDYGNSKPTTSRVGPGQRYRG